MFASKPKSLTLTLFFYTALTIVLATGSEAKGYAPAPIHRRDHTNLNRLIRKRAPQDGLGGLVNGAGNDPPKAGGTDAVTGSASQTTTSSSSSTSTSTSSTSTDTQTSSSTSSSASASSSSSSSKDPLSITGILSSITNTASTTTSSSSSATTSSSSSSSTPVTTAAPTTLAATSSTPTEAAASSNAKVTVTTAAAESSASASAAPASAGKVTRTTLTVLIVIASCVGGTAIIWTIIRKWKFNKSSQFDDRMKPIDWQPTVEDDSGLPAHRRAPSNASSFHSGSGHDNLGGGYGSTIDHARSPSPLPPIPDHDFTAGPTHLAPVGGYADLARGSSPQPVMQEPLARGPSLSRPQYDQYGVPLHHQGGYAQDTYEYNGASRY